jgi:uncharacterized protein YjbJ (UPF0337 family)
VLYPLSYEGGPAGSLPAEATTPGSAGRFRLTRLGNVLCHNGRVRDMGTADKARNKMQSLKGQAKETIGRATGDPHLQEEGKNDQLKAAVKMRGEQVKDFFRGKRRRRRGV